MTRRAGLSIVAVLAWLVVAACGDGPDPPPTEYVEPTRPPLPPVGSCIGVLDALGGVAIPCDSEEALYRVVAYQEPDDGTRCPAETTYTAGLAVVPVLGVCYGDPIPGGTPTPAVPPIHPAGTVVTIPGITGVVTDVLANDVAAVRARLVFVPRACSAGSEPGPVCPLGASPGTEVASFRLSGCSTTFEPESWVGPLTAESAADGLGLYAVYQVDADAPGVSDPPGAYGIVFAGSFAGATPDGPRMVDVRVDDAGGIVGWWSSCGGMTPDAALDELPVGTFVLPPVR